MKVTIEITHPEWLLFGNEIGTDMNQKDDEHIVMLKFITPKGTRVNVKRSHKDDWFTVIGMTVAHGEPVIAIIVFVAKLMSFDQRMGHDAYLEYDDIQTFNGICYFRGKKSQQL